LHHLKLVILRFGVTVRCKKPDITPRALREESLDRTEFHDSLQTLASAVAHVGGQVVKAAIGPLLDDGPYAVIVLPG
jgi:hypothetical protein